MLAPVRSLLRRPTVSDRPVRLAADPPVGWLRPPLSRGAPPLPESVTRRRAIRGLALAALAVTTAYLAWRIVATVDLRAWWVSIPLLALEIHAAVGLALLTFSLWDLDSGPHAAPVHATADRIAVLIPTRDESIEILTPTIAAARALRVDHDTWVLDDGARPEVARLAADLGARYWARTEPRGGRAGNLDHALGIVDADVIAILDADAVAAPDFLVRTLGYLADPRVALVQTPDGIYNVNSFGQTRRLHERTLFQRLIQPGRNRWQAAVWTGSGAVIRVSALHDIGGIATDTLAPDLQTTIRLHRRGWRTVAHNAVLARGLAPTTAATDQVQRQRRAVGAMQVLRVENPLLGPGLERSQRLAYAATLLGWFDAWRWLGIVVLPIAILLTDADPVRADVVTFAAFFAVTYALQATAGWALSRGTRLPFLSTLLQVVRMTPDLQATRHLFARRPIAVAVVATPKGRTSDVRRSATEPRLLRMLALISVFAASWFALAMMVTLFTGTPLSWAVQAAFGWLILNVFVLVRAIGRVRNLRFGGERRTSVRFETAFAGTLDGARCQILDLSLSGARVTAGPITAGPAHALVIDVDGHPVALEVSVRSVRADGSDRTVLGLEFLADQNLARAELALGLFQTTVVSAAEGLSVSERVVVGGEATESSAA